MTDNKNKGTQHISCYSCAHFYITYEQRYPYGCRVIGFKSARMPAIDVYINSQIECGLFLQKKNK